MKRALYFRLPETGYLLSNQTTVIVFDNYVPNTVFLLYFGSLVAIHGDMGAHIGITDFAFQLPNEFRNTGRHKDFLIDSFIYMF